MPASTAPDATRQDGFAPSLMFSVRDVSAGVFSPSAISSVAVYPPESPSGR